jgi:hypothetical protein
MENKANSGRSRAGYRSEDKRSGGKETGIRIRIKIKIRIHLSDLTVAQVSRNSQAMRAGESLTVHRAGSFTPDSLNGRRFGPGGRQKAPNKANWNQPEIDRPQRVNVECIRISLCKTNPIPGRRCRDLGGLAMPGVPPEGVARGERRVARGSAGSGQPGRGYRARLVIDVAAVDDRDPLARQLVGFECQGRLAAAQGRCL